MSESVKTPLIIANWKMNTTVGQAEALVKEMLPGLKEATWVGKVICPPFVSLVAVKSLLEETNTWLGAQNMYYAESGAYTGEISPLMLRGLCDYVIIGHSERRRYFHEDSELINQKIKAALRHDLRPVLCIGEDADENGAGRTKEVLESQLKGALRGLEEVMGLAIAYEPVWAIGSGKIPQGQEIATTLEFVRRLLATLYDEEVANSIYLLYGGSINHHNSAEIIALPQVNGLLVGSASLQPDQFLGILNAARNIPGY